ncbi:S-adenosylmethionine-dependent methyltransferase [Coccidioides posadasii str. Silveira]|uniref:S-adenosylmethionine-dependent methyltransferase n=1 Tax=Coccidioides posadasii (strain RMSCC 757 / Silveira) TaxID=443226 RepID=UPI001BF11F02|nr:S-adenosylmethionine-dependent methyltransferase [Coccidioides posadasii str. Silveira]
MLPTPSTSHVCFDTIYEPAEDSYLLLDTLSSKPEAEWLSSKFSSQPKSQSISPLVVEIGTGSGVVLAFVAANSKHILGRSDILTLGVDVNINACAATAKTVHIALEEKRKPGHQNEGETRGELAPQMIATIAGDLCSPLRAGAVDILIFNPPYVPTPELPPLPSPDPETPGIGTSKFEQDSHLLSLSYAGGEYGMETTNRLLQDLPEVLNPHRGVAYILLCAQNKPDEVVAQVKDWGSGWNAEVVGRSGVKAGWEKLWSSARAPLRYHLKLRHSCEIATAMQCEAADPCYVRFRPSDFNQRFRRLNWHLPLAVHGNPIP